MAKFSGTIGFSTQATHERGIWNEEIKEVSYRGDLLRVTSKWQQGEDVIPDTIMRNKISVVADDYMYANLGQMRYVKHRNSRWAIASIEEARPRIIITYGGVYNGPIPSTD